MKHNIHFSFIEINTGATEDSNVQVVAALLDLITCTVGVEGGIALKFIRELEKCGVSVQIEQVTHKPKDVEKWAR